MPFLSLPNLLWKHPLNSCLYMLINFPSCNALLISPKNPPSQISPPKNPPQFPPKSPPYQSSNQKLDFLLPWQPGHMTLLLDHPLFLDTLFIKNTSYRPFLNAVLQIKVT